MQRFALDKIHIALSSIVLLFLVKDALGLSLFYGRVDPNYFGNLGDWFSGIMNFSAVIVALVSIASSRRNLDFELRAISEARAEDRARDESERANQVFSWSRTAYDHAGRVRSVVVCMNNMTNSTIVDWSVFTAQGSLSISSVECGPIFPGYAEFEVDKRDWINLASTSTILLSLRFTNRLGKIATRHQLGQLTEE
jgi:hypothetical protein